MPDATAARFGVALQWPAVSGLRAVTGLSRPAAIALDLLLVPLWLAAVWWVRRRERAILRDGVALTPEQRHLARAAGVSDIERVRIVAAVEVPLPLPYFARRIAQRAGWIASDIAGMTLGHGIVVREDCQDDSRLLVHELTHVHQYERLGGIAGFLRPYLRECVWPGYPLGALEQEAHTTETRGSKREPDVIPYVPIVTPRPSP